MENTNAPVVSVVIPMYNAAKYIGECLDSLLMQTFTDFEVIIIDDCSTDNSCAVVESFVKKFGGRLRIHGNKKNSGAAASRNNGLMISRGEYIFFMDSDDLLMLDGLERMYNTAEEFQADVIDLSRFYKMSDDAKTIKTMNYKYERVFFDGLKEIFVDDDLAWRMKKPMTWRFFSVPWLRFFKRDFLIRNKLFFPENVMRCEDVVWKYGFLFLAKRIVHVSYMTYFYRISNSSLSRQKRTHAEYINSRMTTIIDGIKWIDDVMGRVEFFKKNPHRRYEIFDEFMDNIFERLLIQTQKKDVAAVEIYEAVKEGFGKKLGKHDVLVAELCSLIDDQNKEIAKLKERLKS